MSDLIKREDIITILCFCEETKMMLCKELRKILEKINNIPSAESAHKAPISFEEQLSLDCSFCRQHECGDTLYESADWDVGIGFDYIKDIRFCPICGRELYGYEDEERRENE